MDCNYVLFGAFAETTALHYDSLFILAWGSWQITPASHSLHNILVTAGGA